MKSGNTDRFELSVSAHSDAALRERHRVEASFHDHKYATGETLPRHYAVNPTYPVFSRMLNSLGPLTGKRVLEYGCGTGWMTVEFARRGAHVSAFDISPEAVAQAEATVRHAGFRDRCTVQVMAAENLEYPSESFDLAVGFAILHHLDVPATLAALYRVLKPGGSAFFGEPLGTNPLINLYRRVTPHYRTPDERPIDVRQLARRASAFRRFEHRDQLLLATAALGLAYVPGLSGAAPLLQRQLMRIDDALLRIVPWAGRWAWYSILRFEK